MSQNGRPAADNPSPHLPLSKETPESPRDASVEEGGRSSIGAPAECSVPLALTRAQYADWLDLSCSGIAIVRCGIIDWCNRRFAAIFRRSRESITGLPYQELILPEERARMNVSRGGDGVEPQCLRARTEEGREIHLRSALAAVAGSGGRIVLWSLSDVTRETLDELALASARLELQSVAEQMVTVQETERRRIAGELHDGIGQMLSAIKIAVCAERARAGPSACERCGTLSMVLERLQETIEEVRRIALDLRPAMLDDLGLIPTLEWFSRELGKGHPGIRASMALRVSESEIAAPLRVTIFRIVQEAARNAVVHAQPREVAIELSRQDGMVILRVRDDGVGFSPESGGGPGRPGLGLGSMRERARLSGGALEIRSVPGGGTTVEARWPTGIPQPLSSTRRSVR